jgi:hypothetical protein
MHSSRTMSTNHLYPGLPRAPASANLPRKPDSQSASLESSAGHGSASTKANNDLRLNVLAETPGHYSTVRPTTPVLPQLSSTTQDILARVQGGRSTPAASGPPKGLFRDTNSITGLLPSSVSSKSENTASPFPSTSKNPATGPIRSVLQQTSTPNARQTTGGGPITNNGPAKAQTLTSFKLTSQTSGSPQPSSAESTIQVGSIHPQASMIPASASTNPAPSSSSSSSRRQRSYVLNDGTVVSSGKGLGRGRPGIKRGPRKPKLDPTSSTVPTTNTPAPSSLPGKKRKHSTLREDEERVKTPVSFDNDDEEDSDNYTPQATQTRSGRSTQRPQSFVSADSPAAKKPRPAAEPPNAQVKNPLIKKKIYRGREQNALCEYCLRGRGPTNNAIVFCDGCNLCWHQNCHDPRIPKELVLDKTAEWFCKDCVVKLKLTATKAKDTNPQQTDESTVRGVPNATEVVAASTEQPVLSSNTTLKNTAVASGMPRRSFDLHKHQQYFSSLSRQALIDLLLQAYSLAPELPIFNTAGQINAPAPPPPQIVPPSVPSASPLKANPVPTPAPTTTRTPPPTITARPATTTTPSTMKPPPPPLPLLTTSPNPNLNPSRAAKAAAPKYTSPSSPSSESAEDSESEEEYEEEEEEDYGPSHPKVYPKPGQGVMAMLPPDSADEHMLLEGAESRTFSHSLKGQGPLVVVLG